MMPAFEGDGGLLHSGGMGRLFRIAVVVFLAWPKLQITVIIMPCHVNWAGC